MTDDSDAFKRKIFSQRIRSLVVRHRVSLRDLGIIAAVMLIMTFYAYEVDIFREQGQVGTVDQAIETDELLMLGGILMAAMLIFSIRRYLEQKRETKRRILAEQEARRLAYQDTLTGLPNRRQLEEALAVAVGSPPRAGSSHGLLMLDLNGFKRVNDTHGHGRGDELLVIVAQRLLRAVKGDDLVARLGGDEFCVLARNLSGVDAAAGLASRIIDLIAEEIVIDGVRHDIGVGIGIALVPDDADTVSEAFRKADVALYRAKAERRSSLRFFEVEMDRSIREKEDIERLLRAALRQDRIGVRFRPSLDITTGRILGFQISPHIELERGADHSQQRILAIAEETGLSHQLARRTLQLGCEAASSWRSDTILSFDLFAGQINDDGLAFSILELARNVGLAAERLEIGVDESTIVHDLEVVRRAIEPLQRAGVKIALANFGTGYSNLYHIQAIRLDKVKIDSRFTDGDAGSMKIARALAGLGQGLGMAVSAVSNSMLAHDDSLHGAGVQELQWQGLALSAAEALDMAKVPDIRHPAR